MSSEDGINMPVDLQDRDLNDFDPKTPTEEEEEEEVDVEDFFADPTVDANKGADQGGDNTEPGDAAN